MSDFEEDDGPGSDPSPNTDSSSDTSNSKSSQVSPFFLNDPDMDAVFTYESFM